MDELSACEQAITGGRLLMLAYLEGKYVEVGGSWHLVENGCLPGGMAVSNYTIPMLEEFCRSALSESLTCPECGQELSFSGAIEVNRKVTNKFYKCGCGKQIKIKEQE